MKKILLALTTVVALTTAAHADYYQPRHHYHHNNGGNNWVGPLVGGLIIGGMIGAASRPRYEERYYYDEPYCFRQPMYDRYGYFVGYRTICR